MQAPPEDDRLPRHCLHLDGSGDAPVPEVRRLPTPAEETVAVMRDAGAGDRGFRLRP